MLLSLIKSPEAISNLQIACNINIYTLYFFLFNVCICSLWVSLSLVRDWTSGCSLGVG